MTENLSIDLYVKYLTAILLVLSLLYFSAKFFLTKYQFNKKINVRVNIVESLFIASNTRAVLIEVDSQRFLVIFTANAVALHKIDGEKNHV